jgi:hypothetical protein
MTVHDGKLYIMGHVGGSIVGGTIILDPLPPSAIYGTQGASSSDGVNFTLTLGEQDFYAWTQADTDALIAAIKAETGAAQVNITIESGSVKAVVDVVLPSGSDQAAKDAVLAKVDTVPKLNAILAASPNATLQTAASQNNTATAPVQQSVSVQPQILSSGVSGENIVFDILGAYNALQWKTGESWVTLAAPFPISLFGGLEGAQSIEFRLISPDSTVLGIPATLSISFPAQFAYYITGLVTSNATSDFNNTDYQYNSMSMLDALNGFRGLTANDHTYPYTPANVTKSMDMTQFYATADWKMTVAFDFTPASMGQDANNIGQTGAFGDPAGVADSVERPIAALGNDNSNAWRFQFQYSQLTFKSYGGNVTCGWRYSDMAGMEGDTFRFYWQYDNGTRITKLRIHNVTKDTILPMDYNNRGTRTDSVLVDDGINNKIDYKWKGTSTDMYEYTDFHAATYPFDGTGTKDFSSKNAQLADHQLHFGFYQHSNLNLDHRPIGSTNGWTAGSNTHPTNIHSVVAVGTYNHILVHNNIVEFDDLPF